MPVKSGSKKTLADIFADAINHVEGMGPLRHLVEIELKRTPDDFELLKIMGGILFYQDEHEEAVPFLQKAIKQKPRDEDLHAELGISLYKTGRYAEALPHLKDTLRRYPKDHDQEMMVGFALYKTGDRQQAAKHLRSALTHDADFDTYAAEITELALAGLAQPKPRGRRPAPL